MKSYRHLKEFLTALPQQVAEQGEESCYRALDSHLRMLTAWREALSPGEDEREARHFRELLASTIHESTFCRHVYEKPRGYAGDYITQEMVWLGRTQGGSYRYSGTTEAGRIINSLVLDMEHCRANEERIYRLRNMLSTAGPRIASIGCGCGIEYWDLPEGESRELDILLVDKDTDALAHARNHLYHRNQWNVTYREDNVLKFALRDPGIERASRDLVYSFGLLDYFTLPNAQRIISGLWQYVAPGGYMVLVNAHPSNPTRLWMEYGADWFLDYKDEQAFRSLADVLSTPSEVSYTIDSYGIYQYLRIAA